MAGRKSLKEEIKLVQRMSELSEPTFKFIMGLYDAGDKEDKKWAVEQMMKLYARCVPQEHGNDPDNPLTIQVVQVAQEVANKNNVIDTSTGSNSEGYPQVQGS